MLEFTGTLFRIDGITSHEMSKGGVYSNRTFVARYHDPEGREQLVKFNLEPPLNLNIIESFELGQEITVKFYLCGKETPSRFNNGMNFFEKKRVISVEPVNKNKPKDNTKTQQYRIHVENYVGPDLTQDFSMFPETIDF